MWWKTSFGFLIHSHPKNALTIVEYILTCLLVISRSNLQAGRSLVFYWVIAMSFPDFPIHSYLCKAVQWKVMQYNWMQCNGMQCNAMQGNVIRCDLMWCDVMLSHFMSYNVLSLHACMYITIYDIRLSLLQCCPLWTSIVPTNQQRHYVGYISLCWPKYPFKATISPILKKKQQLCGWNHQFTGYPTIFGNVNPGWRITPWFMKMRGINMNKPWVASK